MTATAERLKEDLVRLSLPERAELVQFLLDSLDEGSDPDAEQAWDAELAQREHEIPMWSPWHTKPCAIYCLHHSMQERI